MQSEQHISNLAIEQEAKPSPTCPTLYAMRGHSLINQAASYSSLLAFSRIGDS